MAKTKKKEALSLEEKIEQALVPVDEQPCKVPDNWCWTKNNIVCQLGDGIKCDGDMLPYLEVKYLRGVKEAEILSKGKLIEAGTKVILVDGENSGEVFDIREKGYMGSTFKTLAMSNGVNDKYLLYFIHSNKDLLRNNKTGSAIPHLNKKLFFDLNFPLPPLAEQQRIVEQIENLFAKLDEAKDKVQDALDGFGSRKNAVLYKAFSGELSQTWRESNNVLKDTWSTILLKELLVSGPQNGMYKEKSAYGNGTKILRIDGFYDGYIVAWDKLKRLTLNDEELELYCLNVNDIVINRVNSMPYLGKSALVRELPEECVYESNMMRIKIDESKVYPEYLIKYLNSMMGLQELRKNAKQAVNQASINQQDVKNVKVILPSLDEQIEIVRLMELFTDEEVQAKEKIEAAIEQIDLMKKSILAKAFRGELGTNNPDEESAVELLKSILATE